MTKEQLIILWELIEQRRSHAEMYPIVGVKHSLLTRWRAKLKKIGLDECLKLVK